MAVSVPRATSRLSLRGSSFPPLLLLQLGLAAYCNVHWVRRGDR
jgi:hypothetical protein